LKSLCYDARSERHQIIVNNLFKSTVINRQIKAIPYRAWTDPWGFRRPNNRHVKLVRLSAPHTGSLYPPGDNPVRVGVHPRATVWQEELMEHPSDPIGN